MLRVAPFLPCLLLVLSALAPAAAAELTVSVDQSNGYTITASGAQSLDAPRNTTITQAKWGPRISWDPPAGLAGAPLTGYIIYRVPGPGVDGNTVAVHLPASRDTVIDPTAGDDVYVYFVTAVYGATESIPASPVSTLDINNYPHCGVVGVLTQPPYYNVQLSCLFPLPG